MIKRILFICSSLFVLLAFCCTAEAAPKVMVNYKTVNFDVDPVIENGTTLVPMRAIFEAMGADVTWDGDTKTAIAKKDNTTVILPIGSLTPMINGEPYQLTVPAKTINNRTMVPLRFIGEAFGAEVIWSNEKQSIEITTMVNYRIPEEAKKLETWEKVIGTKGKYYGTCVRQTRDGSYILTGGKNGDIYLAKLSLRGEILWEKTYGGEQRDYGASVQETLDGGFIITGNTSSFGATYGDVFLIKTDSNGNKEWEKTYGRSGEDFGSYVQQTADGGYMIVGTLEPGGAGTLTRELWIIKTDNDGNREWDKSFGYNGLFRGWSGLQTTDGGYILAGDTSDDNKWDIYTVKVDSKGIKQWDKFYSGPDTMDSLREIKQTKDGGYILVGYTSTASDLGFDMCLIKTDDAGKEEWKNAYRYGDKEFAMGESVEQLADGSYVLVGYINSYDIDQPDKAVLLKANRKGEIEWYKTLSNELDNEFSCIQLTYDGGLIIVGNTNPHKDYETETIHILKIDSDGNISSDKSNNNI